MVVVVLEFCGDFFPECLVAGLVVLIFLHVGHQPCRTGGSRVVMHVQNAVHPFVYHVVHYLLHACHPLLVDAKASPCALVPDSLRIQNHRAVVRIPGHRDSYGVETGFLEHMNELAGRHRLSPACLIRCDAAVAFLKPHVVHAAAVGVHRVA